MRRFDYSFLEHGMLPAGLVNIVSAISELKERENERKGDFGEVFVKLADVSPTTVEAVLSGMLKAGLIEKIGASRNTKYIKKSERKA